ncbi:lysozyme inhibitor LprI family protein [Enterobacteriaceae bacterium C34A]
MKFLKLIPVTLALACAANAHAGFFSSKDDFKCGRDDAMASLKQYIKDTSGGFIQKNSMSKSKALFNKPASVFIEEINSIPVDVTGVSTAYQTRETEISCRANISIALPQEAIDVIQDNSDHMSSILRGQATLHNKSIVWKEYSYDLKLADNGKDITVTDNSSDAAASVLYNVSLLAVNKSEIIASNNGEKENIAQSEYQRADANLNALWKNIPDSLRTSMKSSQLAWVKEKTTKCGTISDAMGKAKDASTRIEIFNCQTKMTNERISFLGGDN